MTPVPAVQGGAQGLPGGVAKVTVAEFLAAQPNDGKWYSLTGTISNITDMTFGNFDLSDNTGSVYVYGLTRTKVSNNDRSFASLGLKAGDVVTLVGQRDVYKGKDEVAGPAYYISHTAGAGGDYTGGAAGAWLELPAKGSVATASEYITRDGAARNYTAYYDTQTYSSLWVAYPLAKGHTGSLSRPKEWSFAPGISESLQVNLTQRSYVEGHSRGHQIPNADRNGNSTMQLQAFYVINSTPQLQDKFNGSIWSNLEDQIRASIPSNDTLYIATGPVYKTAGGSETIKYTRAKDDDKQIPIANYFFKVVMKVKRSGGNITNAKAVGFWFEHKEYSDRNFETCAVSVDEIERKTGWDFFTNLPDDIEAAAEQNASWTTFRNF